MVKVTGGVVSAKPAVQLLTRPYCLGGPRIVKHPLSHSSEMRPSSLFEPQPLVPVSLFVTGKDV